MKLPRSEGRAAGFAAVPDGPAACGFGGGGLGAGGGDGCARNFERNPVRARSALDVSRGGKSAIVPTDRDYLRQYVCAGLSINPEDAHDDGVYCPQSFNMDAIDWQYIQDIKLEIHFF